MATRSYSGTRTPLASALVAILLVWLVIGAIAGGQRGYYGGSTTNCAKTGTIVVTVIAGPLNYLGANPKLNCSIPQPSK
jgi:hypothetical protein